MMKYLLAISPESWFVIGGISCFLVFFWWVFIVYMIRCPR